MISLLLCGEIPTSDAKLPSCAHLTPQPESVESFQCLSLVYPILIDPDVFNKNQKDLPSGKRTCNIATENDHL